MAEQGTFVIRIEYWKPERVIEHITSTPKNYIGLIDDQTILKYPHVEGDNEHLDIEARIYETLQPHPHLTRLRGRYAGGLLLDYYINGSLGDFLKTSTFEDAKKLDLCKQIASGLQALHAQNYTHCDLHVRNIFLDADLNAKIGDFEGQFVDSEGALLQEPMAQENVKSRDPSAGDDEFNARTDIFAFGTTAYHIWCGDEPFPELDHFDDEDEIRNRFKQHQFPPLPPLIEPIILKCWTGGYENACELIRDLDAVELP